MILLAIDVAILDELTRRTCLETNAPRNATIGTAVNIISIMVHDDDEASWYYLKVQHLLPFSPANRSFMLLTETLLQTQHGVILNFVASTVFILPLGRISHDGGTADNNNDIAS